MPVRIIGILLFSFISLNLMPGLLTAQVTVERSKDKVVISGRPYYIHIVRKGETAYSISRAYYISVDELVRENPAASNGIREGQSLRLPVREAPADTRKKPENSVPRDESKYIYHRLSTGDTVYSLARRFGVSEEEILKSNPGVEINKLAVGTEIAVPKREFSAVSRKLEVQQKEKDFISHRVEKGESMASIAEKYGITVRELRRENRGVVFPKVDDYVRIPVSRIAEAAGPVKPEVDSALLKAEEEPVPEKRLEYTPVGELRGKVNMAVMLPFYFRENAIRTEVDSSQVIKGRKIYKVLKKDDSYIYEGTMPFLEMYHGILIAADTLRALGLDINIHVYDITSDSLQLKRLIASGSLDGMDLIIGPVYSHNLAIMAAYASEREIPVISPVPLKSNSILAGNPSVFIVNPSLEIVQEVIAKRISDFHSGNYVFIYADSSKSEPSLVSYRNRIFSALSTKAPVEDIRFKELRFISRSMLSNDSINRLEHTLSDVSENIVIIASENPAVMSETLMDIHTLSKRYNIRLVGYPAMRDLKNLEPRIYFDLGLELFTPFWIDYSRPDIKSFLRIYRDKFLTEPHEDSFAWHGYDIAYFFISGIAMHGKRLLRKPGIHYPDLLETGFEFTREDNDSGFENHRLYLIKYTGEMEVILMGDSFGNIDVNN